MTLPISSTRHAALLRRGGLLEALNATLAWWWADPAAGLVIVYYALREARAIRTDHA
jgi:hypothetical protein